MYKLFYCGNRKYTKCGANQNAQKCVPPDIVENPLFTNSRNSTAFEPLFRKMAYADHSKLIARFADTIYCSKFQNVVLLMMQAKFLNNGSSGFDQANVQQ
jgi:hypothetical protein